MSKRVRRGVMSCRACMKYTKRLACRQTDRSMAVFRQHKELDDIGGYDGALADGLDRSMEVVW